MADEITMAYWDLRGMAEPIRYLLYYKKVKFSDKRYIYGDRTEWLEEKFKLGLEFPNLPYYLEGNTKLTQSLTILRYLAQKHKLDGDSPKQKLSVSLIEQQLIDFQKDFFSHILDEALDAKREEFLKKAQDQLNLYAKFLGDNEYLTGGSITYVDFVAYESFDFYRLYEKTILDNFPTLQKYHQRIKNLPELHMYLSSSTHKRWPLFGPMAKFGGSGEQPEHA